VRWDFRDRRRKRSEQEVKSRRLWEQYGDDGRGLGNWRMFPVWSTSVELLSFL
jgi:hypothetical protein